MSRLCEIFNECHFFKSEMKNSFVADAFKQRYCKINKEMCARYMIKEAYGQDKVPLDLYPNEYDRALNFIKDKGKGEE